MKYLIPLAATVLLTGCGDDTASPDNHAAMSPSTTTTTSQSTTAHNPDNSATNKRDDGTTTTPIDQGKSETDLKATTAIRKAIMDDKAMSINAQNVKIITVNGTVTLRGPVDSLGEKDRIAELAKSAVGTNNVDNQLEVKKAN
jgi:hyperosmotically inducible protein